MLCRRPAARNRARTSSRLFVVFLCVALGAGLYESRVEVPQWIEQTDAAYRWNAEAAREADAGRRFWAFVTTGPLTVLSLASLVLAWRSTGALRRRWLASGGGVARRPGPDLLLLHPDDARPHVRPGTRRAGGGRRGTALGRAGLGATRTHACGAAFGAAGPDAHDGADFRGRCVRPVTAAPAGWPTRSGESDVPAARVGHRRCASRTSRSREFDSTPSRRCDLSTGPMHRVSRRPRDPHDRGMDKLVGGLHGAHLRSDVVNQLGVYGARRALRTGRLRPTWPRVLVEAARSPIEVAAGPRHAPVREPGR